MTKVTALGWMRGMLKLGALHRLWTALGGCGRSAGPPAAAILKDQKLPD
ncbi:MAG: hypothetical protein H8D77_00345 [Chloroflexi bacterium]|nr:hypothetical protein [Chloroflexota bacterium]